MVMGNFRCGMFELGSMIITPGGITRYDTVLKVELFA
jgi:hypothetical protein